MKIKNLSAFLPGFLRKPGSPKPKPAPARSAAAPPTKQPVAVTPVPQPAPAPEPEPCKPTKHSKLLDDLCAFLARYLHCSPHQRTVLALWILHTHCFAAARSTPYLAIQSHRRLSGKSLCLRLLSLLCSHPALTSGYTASALVKRIHSSPNELPTFLLDQSSATVGTRSRAKNPKLQAILVSGFQPGIGYSDHSLECTIYSPKAFASLGPLPEALADCSIPIVLEPLPKVETVLSTVSPGIERFDLETAHQEAQPLVAALENWSKKNLSALKSARAYKYKDFPQRLTFRGQDLVEPLLQLADLVGGDYPARARTALLAVFDDPEKQQRSIDVQLLRDIRACFEHHRWPDALPTALLLADLQSLPARPWDLDGKMTDRTLAKMLRRYKIRPRVLSKKDSTNKSSSARGYLQEEFVDVWKNLLDNPKSEKSEIPNKDAGCYAVSHSDTTPKISDNQRGSAAKDSAVTTSSQKPVSPNNDAAYYSATYPRIYPKIKGILANPANYFRQYPDDANKAELRKIVERWPFYWPQPADHTRKPDLMVNLTDGTRLPFTIINQHPWMENHLAAGWARNERWPVDLDDKEKLQVAVARFHELRAAVIAEREKKQAEEGANREQQCAAVS